MLVKLLFNVEGDQNTELCVIDKQAGTYRGWESKNMRRDESRSYFICDQLKMTRSWALLLWLLLGSVDRHSLLVHSTIEMALL